MNRLGDLQKTADSQRSENSKQVSTIVRTLGTTVIAVAWLFSGSTVAQDQKAIPTLHVLEHNGTLHYCVLAALIALGADVLQYVISMMFWAVYRRAIDAVDLNDNFDPANPDKISRTVRWGWAVLAVFRTSYRLEYEFDLSPTGGWKSRRRALRTELGRPGTDVSVAPPAWLNLPGTLLFFAKVIALVVAWIELFRYLSHT